MLLASIGSYLVARNLLYGTACNAMVCKPLNATTV